MNTHQFTHRASPKLDPFLHTYKHTHTYFKYSPTFYIHITEHSYLFKKTTQHTKWSVTDLIYIILYSFIHNTLAWLQSQRKSTHFEAIISVIQTSFSRVHQQFHNGFFFFSNHVDAVIKSQSIIYKWRIRRRKKRCQRYVHKEKNDKSEMNVVCRNLLLNKNSNNFWHKL